MAKLHPTQERLLELLQKNMDSPLTVRELQDELGLSSTSLVAHHIQQLEKKGYLRRNPYNPQDYFLPNSAQKAVAFLNMYGLAQCGPDGSILDGNPVDRIAVSTRLIDFDLKEAFLVKARGDSMEPLIHEGDLVICKKEATASEGDLVVCVNDGMAMIKRYVLDGSTPLLVSENSANYPPRVAAKDFHIEGEVKGVIRSL